MRRTAPNKRALVKAGNDAADALCMEVAKCEFCQRDYVPLAQHELLQGALRQRTRAERCCVLAVCSECHGVLHSMGKPNSILCGLALIHRSRFEDYDLKKVNFIAKPEAPNKYSVYEVGLWLSRFGERS
jgi:hypothetical protein